MYARIYCDSQHFSSQLVRDTHGDMATRLARRRRDARLAELIESVARPDSRARGRPRARRPHHGRLRGARPPVRGRGRAACACATWPASCTCRRAASPAGSTAWCAAGWVERAPVRQRPARDARRAHRRPARQAGRGRARPRRQRAPPRASTGSRPTEASPASSARSRLGRTIQRAAACTTLAARLITPGAPLAPRLPLPRRQHRRQGRHRRLRRGRRRRPRAPLPACSPRAASPGRACW